MEPAVLVIPRSLLTLLGLEVSHIVPNLSFEYREPTYGCMYEVPVSRDPKNYRARQDEWTKL